MRPDPAPVEAGRESEALERGLPGRLSGRLNGPTQDGHGRKRGARRRATRTRRASNSLPRPGRRMNNRQGRPGHERGTASDRQGHDSDAHGKPPDQRHLVITMIVWSLAPLTVTRVLFKLTVSVVDVEEPVNEK